MVLEFMSINHFDKSPMLLFKVMGAVVSSGHDPMLVMEYMEYGSLYDLLHSESMFFSGEICLQILRDIAQGVRYLHASKPPILHGDLKGVAR